MSDKCDSTHDGNGRPGSGIMFSAAEKLLRAVSVLMDTCGECGVDSSRALAAVKRRENQLIDASARHDAKVSALRERLSAANAKLAEMARLAEETRSEAETLKEELVKVTSERNKMLGAIQRACFGGPKEADDE